MPKDVPPPIRSHSNSQSLRWQQPQILTYCVTNDKDATISLQLPGQAPYFYSIDGQYLVPIQISPILELANHPLIVLDSDQCRQDTLSIASPDAILVDTEVDYNAAPQQISGGSACGGGQALT